MPKLAIRIFQFILLTQTIIWVFAKAKIDPKLEAGINQFHTYWVIFYAIFISLAFFDKCIELFSWLTQIISERIYYRKLLKIVKNLKPQDKHILGKFIVDRKREVFLNSLDDSTEWLTSNKLIIKTGSTADKKDGYKLAIWARDYLIRNPNLLY